MEERTRVQAALIGLLSDAAATPREGQAAQFPTIVIQGDVHIGELRIDLGRSACSGIEPKPAT